MTGRETSGIILAGGKSRRLGVDKALVELSEGRGSLIQSVVGRVSALCEEVIVVTNSPGHYASLPVRFVPDVYLDHGSLGGIYSGLQAATCEFGLVVACDMPFLNDGLLQHMLAQPRDYDVLIPRLDGHLEPLHAIYRKSCLPHMLCLLNAGNFKIIDFFDLVRVHYVDDDIVRRFDPDLLSFFNVNTPSQLERARELILDWSS